MPVVTTSTMGCPSTVQVMALPAADLTLRWQVWHIAALSAAESVAFDLEHLHGITEIPTHLAPALD